MDVKFAKHSLKLLTVLILTITTCWATLSLAEPHSHTDKSSLRLDQVVSLHRQIILLLADTETATSDQQQDVFIARNLYVEKRRLQEAFDSILLGDRHQAVSAVIELIEHMESPTLHPADKLAFIDMVDAALYFQNQSAFLKPETAQKLITLESDIIEIQNAYANELNAIYKKLQMRGVPLESWDEYLAFIAQQHQKDKIRQDFNSKTSELSRATHRGKSSKADPNLVWGGGIPEKTVVLTFDDGPHYRHTDAILDTLKEYGAQAYFFAVGKNFGNIKEDQASLSRNAKKLERAINEGHLLGNHSFSHRILTKLSLEEREAELSNTNKLLASITGYPNKVFRPPYGSRDDALQVLSVNQGMRSIMWNIDSMDWGDPIPDSIVARVMEKLEQKKRGILLFHDIHKQTVQALPKLLKELQDAGYRFVDIDGNAIGNPSETRSLATKASKENTKAVYGDSWAVVIGVNDYQHWPKLSYAINDANAVSNLLKEKYGFKQEHIFTLFNENATRENITELLGDTLADPQKVKPNDRVFIFYAGHGMTRKLPSGRDLGYIIPVDAQLDKFHSKSISMTHIQDFSEMIPAKHIYFVMDSCYSGIALTRSGGLNNNYIHEVSSRYARQILTAGGADQEVADSGPGGHSIFTWMLLNGLKGKADLDKNGVITASELGAYVAPQVSNNSRQTPVFGNLVGSQGGEFIFHLSPQKPPKPPTELEALKQALELEKEKNRELQQQLLAYINNKNTITSVRGINNALLSPAARRDKALSLHEEGMVFYKQKDYSSALTKMQSALAFNPSNPTIVNNYGFILYKNGQYQESLKWLEKTIELDSKRTVVYLNIADTLIKLGRTQDAIPYYEHYLTLHPSSPKASEIKQTIESLQGKT